MHKGRIGETRSDLLEKDQLRLYVCFVAWGRLYAVRVNQG